jgi:predicted HTH domain antitoxin
MTITLEIPEALATQLGGGTPQQVSRRVFEAVVLEAYREDRLGGPHAAEMLGFSRLEWNHFLKEKQVNEDSYSVEDLERDVAAIQRLRAEGVLPPAA